METKQSTVQTSATVVELPETGSRYCRAMGSRRLDPFKFRIICWLAKSKWTHMQQNSPSAEERSIFKSNLKHALLYGWWTSSLEVDLPQSGVAFVLRQRQRISFTSLWYYHSSQINLSRRSGSL
jgi:hypothetical protein